MDISTESFIQECGATREALKIFSSTFDQLAKLSEPNDPEYEDYVSMRDWAQTSDDALNEIQNAVRLGVADLDPYISVLANIERDVIQVREIFIEEKNAIDAGDR